MKNFEIIFYSHAAILCLGFAILYGVAPSMIVFGILGILRLCFYAFFEKLKNL